MISTDLKKCTLKFYKKTNTGSSISASTTKLPNICNNDNSNKCCFTSIRQQHASSTQHGTLVLFLISTGDGCSIPMARTLVQDAGWTAGTEQRKI